MQHANPKTVVFFADLDAKQALVPQPVQQQQANAAFAAPNMLAAALPGHRRQISIRAQEAKERAAAKRAKAAEATQSVADPVSLADAAIIKRAACQPVTIAFVMGRELVSMREATRRLIGLETSGRLIRCPGKRVLTWKAA